MVSLTVPIRTSNVSVVRGYATVLLGDLSEKRSGIGIDAPRRAPWQVLRDVSRMAIRCRALMTVSLKSQSR